MTDRRRDRAIASQSLHSMGGDQLSQLQALVRGTLRFVQDFEGHYHEGAPVDGSPAARELAEQASFAGPWFTEPLTTVHSLAGLLLSVAADHLVTLADVLEPPLPIYADLTVLRGVLDASARAWWLYEPNLNTKARLARGMTEWAYSEYRAQQVLRVSNPQDTSRLDRIRAMQDAAEQYGMRLLGKSDSPAFEEGRPDTRSLLQAMLGDLGVTAWQWTSGVAHGIAFGIMSRIDGAPSELHATGLEARARRRSVVDVYRIAALGLRAHQAAFDRRREHHGWEGHDWLIWKHHVSQTLGPVLQSVTPAQ